AAELEFEEAARLRDEIRRLEQVDLGLPSAPADLGRPSSGSPRAQEVPLGRAGLAEGPRGRSTLGRAGMSARDAVRARARARKERRVRR
ncbi:MAG TPA: UvrB/UvrC motif-containing protein, partial [Stellaceae bacterium]|nr:UvrB/UvrC motif-containing protein [Stellaceae bacterium]